MSQLKIEKGIPIPSHNNRKWPFDKMEVGDSFVVNQTERGSVAGAAWDYAKRNNMKFITRLVPGKQIRVWRIK